MYPASQSTLAQKKPRGEDLRAAHGPREPDSGTLGRREESIPTRQAIRGGTSNHSGSCRFTHPPHGARCNAPANPIISQMPPPPQTRGSLFICETFQNLKYNTQRKVPHPRQPAACCLGPDCLCPCQTLRVPQSLSPAFREDTFLVLVFVPSALPVCALCLCGRQSPLCCVPPAGAPMSVVELHCVNTRDVGTSSPVTGAGGVSGLGTMLLYVFLQGNVL